jgi:hypothetical protein
MSPIDKHKWTQNTYSHNVNELLFTTKVSLCNRFKDFQ